MPARIGITSGSDRDWWGEEAPAWSAYASAVRRAGGQPVHVSPSTRGHERELLASLDGIVFSGGLDIDLRHYPKPPDRYGADLVAAMKRYRVDVDAPRDEYELPLMQEALQGDLPIFGICRGCQLLNVALGGTLILDIALEAPKPIRHQIENKISALSQRHGLRIKEDALLASILPPAEHTWCNSRHHQAAWPVLPRQVRASAFCDEDGIIEAIEIPARRWCLGVQWHPEHPHDPDLREIHQPLFDAFVRACG